jgi:hypothetical protein
MPYINNEMKQREFGDVWFEERITSVIQHIQHSFDMEEREGVCNYAISRIVAGAMMPETGWRYKFLARAYGTFMAAATEFYNRLIGPYEEDCINNNGDIPEYE